MALLQMYGPGRLYRRTRNWNRYLLGSFPPLQRGGAKGLGFMFRLPDMLAGKHKGLIKGAPAASTAMSRQAQANAARGAPAASVKPSPSTTASSVLSQSFAGFSASPLVQSARAAKQRMYNRLPSKEAIRSTISRGGLRATSLLRMPTQNRAVQSDGAHNADLMWQVRRIRSIYLQAQPTNCSYAGPSI